MSEADDVLRSIDQLRRDLSGYHGQLKAHNDLQRHCDNQRERISELEGLYAKAKAENDKLQEDLDFECSENGWAREFLNRMGPKCGTKDCPSLVAYVNKLEDENAKLRRLCKPLIEYTSQDRCEGCACKSRCNDGQVDECWQLTEIRELASELGMEVDG